MLPMLRHGLRGAKLPIKTKKHTFKGLPYPVLERLKVLKITLAADSLSAVIGMGVARLEGAHGCSSCGCHMGRTVEYPPAATSQKWDEIAEYHAVSCQWVKTRGFQI